jgi:ABC-2 type transport system permease protein
MIGAVVRTGFMNLRRDRAALMLSFVVPIVFFSIFASIFGAQRSKTPKTKVAIVDEDRSKQSAELIEALRRESALNLMLQPKDGAPAFTAAGAEAFVRAGSAPVALIIPKGFGATGLQFGQANSGPAFQLLADSSDPIAPQLVSGLLQKTVFTAMPDSMMTAGVDALDRFGGNLTPQQKTTLQQNIDEFRTSRSDPNRSAATDNNATLVRVDIKDLLGEKKKNPVVALYAAGIGVMFLLFTASNAGGTLLEENESGTLDRILTTRVSFTTLLLGKLVYLWLLGMTQLIVMFVWGALVFKLELIQHLTGFLIIASATALATSAFGLLIASASKTRAQLGAISTLTVLSFSALGGSMFPRFLMPESMQKIGLVLFNSWALEGLTDVFWREAPLAKLALPVVVLIAWAIGFFVLARQLTRRWEAS